MRKKLVAGLMMMSIAFSFTINTYATVDQAQGYNWVQEGPVWKAKDTVGNYVVNDWFKDANGVYYYMGADGAMQTGIVNVAGHFYYMGTDGKMVTVDGVYNGVNLVFNKDATSPTYGEVISGAQEMLNLVNAGGAGSTATNVNKNVSAGDENNTANTTKKSRRTPPTTITISTDILDTSGMDFIAGDSSGLPEMQ